MPFAFALHEKVERKLHRLQSVGTIEPVKSAQWAAPISPILKCDGSLRICRDYRLTVNQAATKDSNPMPRIEDLFAKLSGGKRFSKLSRAPTDSVGC